MPTVIAFPTKSAPTSPQSCAVTEMIKEELSYLSSNEHMINCILERMKPFIATLDFDLGLDIEINEENQQAMMDIIPAVQAMQARFDDIISDIISERILHEIHMFHIERATKV
ncbi:hypothetical protein [Enterovibrio norvegicus]|uniref:Uncharacterized protein n=1 Tax=Enterovibrio norvegicus TaxID=188144 RepID=A0A2N7LBE1_9GAMM|nr:hypothetical protein [Enterovibrio norvegicus]PMN92594.1 hypothetical protein BCT23_14020 [Enterovibrio norvegicus]